MGTKMAVAFANIFMSAVETEILSLSKTKPLRWKRYIDDIFSLWNVDKEGIEEFITLANQHHPTIKFTAEISDKEINFLDTTVFKGERFHEQAILDIRTHSNSTDKLFNDNLNKFKTRLHARGYPKAFVERITREVKFSERKLALKQKKKQQKKILPFTTKFHPALPNNKNILMNKWHLIQNQPKLREIFKEPPIISYKRSRSLKDILVKAKL